MFVPQMVRVDRPPIASASDVFGSKFENVAASEFGPRSATGMPFSSTNILRRRAGVALKTSEWMSPLLELLVPDAPGAADREERTKSPLLLVGASMGRPLACVDLVGLELDWYASGDEPMRLSVRVFN